MAYNNETPILKFLEPEIVDKITMGYDEAMSNPDKLMEIHAKYGINVITGIIDEEKTVEHVQEIQNDLLNLVDRKRLDQKQLKIVREIEAGKRSYPKEWLPGIARKGFATNMGLPQAKSVWAVRKQPKIREIFGLLHNVPVEELAMSTDIVFTSVANRGHVPSTCWAHSDQNDSVDLGAKFSVQAIVYLTGCTTEDTATTVVWPGSHLEEIYRPLQEISVPKNKTDHGMYLSAIKDPELKDNYHRGWLQNARRIPVPAGGMLLFNSKCIHQGYNSESGYRVALPVSCEPKLVRDTRLDSTEILRKKLIAVLTGKATVHWGAVGCPHGASNVKYRGDVPLLCLPPEPLRRDLVKFNRERPNDSYGNLKKMSLEQLQVLIKPEYFELF